MGAGLVEETGVEIEQYLKEAPKVITGLRSGRCQSACGESTLASLVRPVASEILRQFAAAAARPNSLQQISWHGASVQLHQHPDSGDNSIFTFFFLLQASLRRESIIRRSASFQHLETLSHPPTPFHTRSVS